MRASLGRWAATVLIVVAIASSAVEWRRLFADSMTVVGAIVLATLMGAAAGLGLRRVGGLAAVMVGAGALLVVGAVVGNPVELATTGLLAPMSRTLVAVPVVVAAAAALVAVGVVGRAPSSAFIVVAAAGAHAVAAAYTSSLRSPGLVVPAVATVLAVGAYLLANVDLDLPVRPMAVLGVAAAGLVAAVGSLVVVGPDGGYDLRAELEPDRQLDLGPSPLAMVKPSLLVDEPEPLFTIEADGLGDRVVDRIPVAYLDRFDGAAWTTSATFLAAGSQLAQPVQSGAPTSGEPAQLAIDLAPGYPFALVPHVGTIQGVSSGALGWDPVTGGIAVLDPERRSYSLEVGFATVDATPSILVDDAGPASAQLDVPPELAPSPAIRQAFLGALSRLPAAEDRWEQMAALEAWMRSADFGYNEQAPGGHSIARLAAYLDAADAPGTSAAGTAEQGAATFALVARILGVPSRVVVGFVPSTPLSADEPRISVFENEIHAWPEVWVPEIGWRAFEPTNRDNTTDDATPTPPVGVEPGSGAQASGGSADGLLTPEILIPEPPEPDDGGFDLSFLRYGLVLLVPLLAVGSVVVSKRVRRRRRRAEPDPRRRAVNAWREVVDRLRDGGLPVPASGRLSDLKEAMAVAAVEDEVIDLREGGPATVEPTAAPTATVALTPDLDELYTRLESAVYAPTPSGDLELDELWDAADRAASSATADWSVRRRLTAAANPRSLLVRR